jgi:enolase
MSDPITQVSAVQIIDCKGRPCVEVEIRTASGAVGRGAAPTGSSVGMHEAFVLRDGTGPYKGLGVRKAIANVHKVIAPALIGMDVADQAALDAKMIALDGTPDKSRLGGNAIYSVSIAAFRAAADARRVAPYQLLAGGRVKTLPVPCFNVINGGKYDGFAQSFNEFLIVPHGTDDVEEAIEMAIATFQALDGVLRRHLGTKPQVASSYGYAAPSDDPAVCLRLMAEAVEAAGYKGRIRFALDCASSEFHDKADGTYLLKGARVTADQLIDYARALTEEFDMVFIEDLLDENDWQAWSRAVARIPRTIILGDDLTVTRLDLLKRAHDTRACDGFILKPNQVGTITEALEAARYATDNGLIAVPSGRSGGVVEDIVMDFSVGLEVPFQKNGAPRSGERIEKLNFLIRAKAANPGCRMYDLTPLFRF